MSVQQPEALWMAPLLDAAELRRLHQADLDNQEWLNKTEWVQVAIQPREFGQHRADIIKQRLDFVAGQRDELLAALKQVAMWLPFMTEIAGLNAEETQVELSEFADDPNRPPETISIASSLEKARAAIAKAIG